MLKVNNIHAYYGKSHILQGLNLEVNANEAVCLLGRNGVGKTTTIRAITNRIPVTKGSISFLDHNITNMSSDSIANLGIGLVPQGREIFPTLSVWENLTLAAKLDNGKGWSLDRIYELFPILKERLKQKGCHLSGGEQQMLAIARALLTNPTLLIMDEPSEGLAPLIIRQICDVIVELKNHNLSILLVEQNLLMAFSVADRLYILNKGQIVYESTPQELNLNDKIKKMYLGI